MKTHETKYTLAQSVAISDLLDAFTKKTEKEIEDLPCSRFIESVIMGGGYGRGEGGVYIHDNGTETLYNDLDFFVICRENATSAQKAEIDSSLAALSVKYADELGIDVDFAPARKPSSLLKVAKTLMFSELKAGHITIFGEKDSLDILPMPDFTDIPMSEAARLMLNRGAGLLFARDKLQSGSASDSDFIARNISKALFACGDSLLIASGKYTNGVQERLARIKTDPGLSFAAPFYGSALEFKKFPSIRDSSSMEEEWLAALNLWKNTLFRMAKTTEKTNIEENRDFLLHNKVFSEQTPFRNVLTNINGMRTGIISGSMFRHPRQRLLADLYTMLLEKKHEPPYINIMRRMISPWTARWKRYN